MGFLDPPEALGLFFLEAVRFPLSQFGPEPIGYVLHGVQRPKPPNTRSNAS
ncbi:hypothetical protein CRG98_021289 [Punica granatum]|uniref:Uncharacterized protein n=1 Tax=Punica granatum TaxID=22663 RepID=A0A2I0JPU4_PUNGR|nr:hypothetical protein CRG98_021289 [Punica granatum]